MKPGAANCLVTCEHASNRVPAALGGLGLPARQLERHIAWDRGAAIQARLLARALACPLHVGRWSRLVVDLNRSVGHEKLIAAESFGVRVPGNQAVSPGETARRVRAYYRPFRRAATLDLVRILRTHGTCLHWSVHSFTPVVDGVVRDCDVGLLYDPARRGERRLAAALRPLLAAHGLRVRMNYPYRGTSDGFTTGIRRVLPESAYLALEIETNQKLLATPAAARRMGRILAAAVVQVLDTPGAQRVIASRRR